MNSAVLLCVVVVVGVSGADIFDLSPAQMEKAAKFTAECIKETGIKPEVIAEAKKGHFSEDENLKKFIFCFFRKAEIVGQDGKLNMETALSKLPPSVDKAAAKKVLEGCKSKTGKDAVDTTFEIMKCYRQADSKSHSLGF